MVPTIECYLVVEVPRSQITDPIYDLLWSQFLFMLIYLAISLITAISGRLLVVHSCRLMGNK